MLPFSIQILDGIPISDQIVQAVRKAVLVGELVDGEAFPSVRTLGQELRISPTTAHKVVAQLKHGGYLASRPGIGMVVKAPQLPTREERMNHLLPVCRKLLQEASELNLSLEEVIVALKAAAKESESRARAARENQKPS